MLKRDDIDTIDVCVHNNLHVPVAIEVMKAGFDCYCEKPAAVTYADAKLMLDCAKEAGQKVPCSDQRADDSSDKGCERLYQER